MDPKDVLALKHLREKFQKLTQSKLNGRLRINAEAPEKWDELAMRVLAKRLEEDVPS
jgi:hypothetical protein